MFTAAVVACLVVTSHDLVPLPPITPNNPPVWFTRLLPSLKVGVLSKKECAELMADPFTRPYIAAAILGDDQPKDKVLNALFRDSVWADRAKQREGWRKAGRIDLIAEAAVVAGRADPDVAKEAGPELAECLAQVAENAAEKLKAKLDPKSKEYGKRLGPMFSGLRTALDTSQAESGRFGTTYSWPTLRIKDGRDGTLSGDHGTAATADRFEVVYGGRFNGLYVASDGVVAEKKSQIYAGYTVLVSNGPIDFSAADAKHSTFREAVLLADGDITLPGGYFSYRPVLIARGDIRLAGTNTKDAGLLVAGGRIRADKPLEATDGVMFAKGGVEVASGEKGQDALAGVGPADLGIRWFELADVGLEVVADGKTAVVKRVAEKSPFSGRLEPKDVLTAINGTKVTTPDECRRALRRAVVLAYAVLDVQRDGKALNRLVRVDDVLK